MIAAKDRKTRQVAAKVIDEATAPTLRGFVAEHAEPGATVYTDGTSPYRGMTGYDHDFVRHSVGEYVRGMVHTNGVESFWSMLKRAHKGVYHKLSAKHLQRYVNEFAGRQNIRQGHHRPNAGRGVRASESGFSTGTLSRRPTGPRWRPEPGGSMTSADARRSRGARR